MRQTSKQMMLTAALAICGLSIASAQPSEQFSIATMNIDGLPPKILKFVVNPDGPGGAGTVRIGKYINRQAYDLVMMQEDFNYHQELTAILEDDYSLDEFSGQVGIDSELTGTEVDFFHLQNLKFGCDGLMAAWRHDIAVTQTERTAWTDAFGKFSHCNDELITKGFRRYEVTLGGGTRIVVYNMHFDASDSLDGRDGTDQNDRQARQAQWKQLREEILARIDDRPIIVVGDMCSTYARDNIQGEFVEAINSTDRATVSDVWVQLMRDGKQPGFDPLTPYYDNYAEELRGESIDKIFYVNPAGAPVSVQPISCRLDIEAYNLDNRPLADHYPLTATFETVASKSGIEDATDQSAQCSGRTETYDLLGRRVKPESVKGIVIKRDGSRVSKIFVK